MQGSFLEKLEGWESGESIDIVHEVEVNMEERTGSTCLVTLNMVA